MEQEIMDQESQKLEEYYWDQTEADLDNGDNKNFTNRVKAFDSMLKAKNQEAQIALDSKKLEFEIEQAKETAVREQQKINIELEKIKADALREQQRMAIEEQKINIELQKIAAGQCQLEFEKKKSKRDGIFGWVKAGLGFLAALISALFGLKIHRESMRFEETGSYTTATGKNGLNKAQKSADELAKVKS